MPLLSLKTNISLDQAATQSLVTKTSATVADILAKPESYVMVVVQPEQAMSFAGDTSPCALVELRSLGLPEEKTGEMSSQLCDFLQQHTGIPSARIYIEFISPARHLWGWDRRTF